MSSAASNSAEAGAVRRVEEWDVVIIGSGAGGVCAALAAKDAGLNPIILESTDKFGGTTAMSGGVMWIPMHPLMRRRGVTDTFEESRAYLDGCAGQTAPGSTRERRDAYLRAGPDLISFLENLGMKFVYPRGWSDYHEGEIEGGKAEGRSITPEIFDLRRLGRFAEELRPVAGRPPVRGREPALAGLYGQTWESRWAMLKIGLRMIQNKILSRKLVGTGPALQGRLYELLLKKNVAMRKRAPARDLVLDGERVAGVIAEVNDEDVELRARHGVLIASGGFAQNADMRRAMQPQVGDKQWSFANPGDQGVMLKSAMAIGADTFLLDQSWWVPVSLPPGGGLLGHTPDTSKPHCIIVDGNGDRFVNESTSYVTLCNTIFEHNRVAPTIPCWAIFDADHRDRYLWGGVAPKQTPKDWLQSGYLKRADTLASLAALCGIDASRLEKTVARFNVFAARGEDPDFGRGRSAFAAHYGDPNNKPNANLGAIERAPFFAVAIYPGDVGTSGGLVCDEHARVLRTSGEVIEGLYATGNVTATVMGRSYPGAGASIGPSAVFGYIAARRLIAEASARASAAYD